jgi:type IV secretory pathway TraG/TraD family ATPase VirD4
VPLDKWSADSRGWGIDVTAVVQDLAQLRTTWGPDRAKTIYANLPTKIILPGVANKEDLEELSYLAGTRLVERVSAGESFQAGGFDTKRSVSTHSQKVREPVITGQDIYGLPKWHAYVLGLAPRACVVKFEPGYQRARRENRRLGKAARALNLPALGWSPAGDEGVRA